MTPLAPARGGLAVERAIATVGESFRFILDITPVNAEEQRRAFLAGDIEEPDFLYRGLEEDPRVLAAELAAIELESVEDDALRALLSAKQREVELQLEMLCARGGAGFVALSGELYGPIDSALMREAEAILRNVPPPERSAGACVRAAEFADLAERELAHYRALEPGIDAHVQVRPDVAGVMVSGNVLMVSSATRIAHDRVQALLQHEVGTHLLTHINGDFQPMELLSVGLAGYEETQEGLAVLAEFAVGGLTRFRLRQLAVRVVAVSRMLAGESFGLVHRAIVELGFPPHTAFTTTMRVFRSGGFTKDAIYLRGLLDVLHHLRDRRELDVLWTGKFSLAQVPLLDDLIERGLLRPPRLRPRYLEFPDTARRLDEAVAVSDLSGLMGEIT